MRFVFPSAFPLNLYQILPFAPPIGAQIFNLRNGSFGSCTNFPSSLSTDRPAACPSQNTTIVEGIIGAYAQCDKLVSPRSRDSSRKFWRKCAEGRINCAKNKDKNTLYCVLSKLKTVARTGNISCQ